MKMNSSNGNSVLSIMTICLAMVSVDSYWTTTNTPTVNPTSTALVLVPRSSIVNLVQSRQGFHKTTTPRRIPFIRSSSTPRSITTYFPTRSLTATTTTRTSTKAPGHSQETGICSWYRDGWKTANGERFDPEGMTAAHPSLPFNSWVKVSAGARSVLVRINDRGPGVKGRILDLSYGAAKQLGMIRKGLVRCQVNLHR